MSRLNDIMQKYDTRSSIFTLSETDISGITEQTFNPEQAFTCIRSMKERVLTLLINYQKELSKDHSDFRKLQSALNTDAQQINFVYGQLTDQLKTHQVVPSQEIYIVMNVIEEFVLKFSGLKATEVHRFNKKSESQQIPSPQKVPTSQGYGAANQLENELSTFLQISNISRINCTLQDDTFYRATSNPQIQLRLQAKIERLKARLEKVLSRQQLSNTRKILKEAIDDLNRVLTRNDIKEIKSIVFKLESAVQRLSQTQLQGDDTVGLYKLLQKAIKFSKKKEKLTSIEEKQESQVTLSSKVSEVSLPSTSNNAFLKKKSNLFIDDIEHRTLSTVTPLTVQSFRSEISDTITTPLSNMTIQPAMTPVPIASPPNHKSLQTQFLHLCLRVKATLPLDHPGRKILIFSLFDKAQEKGVNQCDWQAFVERELSTK